MVENWFTKPGFGAALCWVCLLGKTAKQRVHKLLFSPDPANLPNLIFRDWPRSGEF